MRSTCIQSTKNLPLEIVYILAPFASFETVFISSSLQIKEEEEKNGAVPSGDEEKQDRPVAADGAYAPP